MLSDEIYQICAQRANRVKYGSLLAFLASAFDNNFEK